MSQGDSGFWMLTSEFIETFATNHVHRADQLFGVFYNGSRSSSSKQICMFPRSIGFVTPITYLRKISLFVTNR
ncbi:MAG TPA: hypothetical protein VHQ64_18805 [Pyrinomonadaceae bacterium]|nr:hypothetical protein [Pyrinomonadaceae bacterium]